MRWSSKEIFAILDEAAETCAFPRLDNGYFYLAATRLSLFRSEQDWALVIETFGYSPRAGLPSTHVYTFASNLHKRNTVHDYVSEEAYQNYLKNNPHNEFRSFDPIEEGDWMEENYMDVAPSGQVMLRERSIPLPDLHEYATRGIELEKAQPQVFELCRYLAEIAREDVLATPEERRISVLPELKQIRQLEEWHHPDLVHDELPSGSTTFQQLVDILVAGDKSIYDPENEPNTHWSNWPEGGRL